MPLTRLALTDVVPSLHWYLAIIYEPEHTLKLPLPPKELSLSQRGKLRRKNATEPDVITDSQPEAPPDLLPLEERSELGAEAASMHATCASTLVKKKKVRKVSYNDKGGRTVLQDLLQEETLIECRVCCS